MELQQTLEEYFQWFHRHPELGFQETATTAHIREILSSLGVEILDTGLETGLVACIRGSKPGPVIALRSDIDALPITEASGLAYASEHEGRMHACGHDFHLTALLGAAHLLKSQQDKLAGTIKLLFQPSEEMPGGAQRVLDTGVLDDVKEIYGLHVNPFCASGTVAVSAGPTHAAVGVLNIRIAGRGGHAGYPHLSADPIIAQAQLVNAIQPIVSRNTDPFQQAVISITRINGGSAWNVIPSEVLLEGTVRTLKKEVLNLVRERLQALCRGIGESSGTAIELDLRITSPATNNDPLLTDFVIQTARDLGIPVVQDQPSMGGEDFALYQERIPGVFWIIGVGGGQPIHHPGFIADPAPLSRAAELSAALGIKSLQRLASSADR
jgi:amidohydrolase